MDWSVRTHHSAAFCTFYALRKRCRLYLSGSRDGDVPGARVFHYSGTYENSSL